MVERDIEKRVATSMAVGRYLRACDRFQDASRDFTTACKSLRDQLGPNCRFVAQVDYRHYLVTSDANGNFEVELIESL